MIYNSDESHRRTLSFPAVKPSDTISLTTLLNSLRSLCSQARSFKSHAHIFTSNKHSAKHALRLVELLHFFLEEVPLYGSFEGKSVILPLLDLHVALQKLNFLLQDITRGEASVWMLMNSGSVARYFRVIFGSVIRALEALPSDVIARECNDGVGDCVGLLTRQAKRVGFEVGEDDAVALDVIGTVWDRFERRVIPDPSDLRWVMDYLKIKAWSECNDQVKFLEEENGSFESGSESAMSLLGLMVYCRCVLFDHIDSENIRVDKKFEYDMGCLNSDDFKCPISLEIMADPVTISTGHTYDRSSIVKWFKSGNPVCPKTGQRVKSLDLVPNLALKHLIKQYCLENEIALPTPKVKGTKKSCPNNVGSLVAKGAMKMAVDFLSIKLAMGTIDDKSKAAYEVRLLTKNSAFNKASCVESGVIPFLLNLLLAKDSTTQENSIAALLNLSKLSESKPTLVNNGGLGKLVGVLKSGIKMEAREHAAATLFYLSSVEEYRRLIGNNPDAISSLVELIRVGGDRGKKNALVAIFGLLVLPSNHYKVLEVRLVPLLTSLLGTLESEDLIVDCLAVLSALADKPHGARAIMRAKALNAVVTVLCSSSSDCSRFRREHCVSLLLALSIHCGSEVVEVLIKNTSLTGALYSLLIEGTARASKKASLLIGILHQFSERSSSSPSLAHALPHENFIHV